MSIRRKFAVTVLLGTGLGLTGCQSPSQGGLAFWKKTDNSSIASATPDVGKQKYEGLAKEFGKTPPKTATALGGQKPAEEDGMLASSWKKTTGAVAGVFSTKTPAGESLDPLRLDQPSRKVGPEVYVGAAQLLENQSKFAEAEVQYQKALKASPNDLNALVGMARMHDRQGHTVQAVEIYQRALKAHPNSGLVMNDLGLCYARQRQFEPALAAMTRAVEANPENPKYRNNLATILVETGKIDGAVRTLSVGASPAIAHYNVGYLLQQKGQTEVAARHLQQALAIDPGLTPAREMLAQLGGNLGAQPLAQTAAMPPAQPTYQTAHVPPPTRGGSSGYYDVPQVEIPAQAAPTQQASAPGGPSSYRLTDETPPITETASRWGNLGTQHLPPVE